MTRPVQPPQDHDGDGHDRSSRHDMRVRIDFHGPFRVGTGRPHDGADDIVDRDDLLPASSLKGVMRASAAVLLPGRADLIDAVFGGKKRRGASPWHWSGAQFAEEEAETAAETEAGTGSRAGSPQPVELRARVDIDPVTGTARKGRLLFAEEVWARTATFEVTRSGPLTAEEEETHLTVLACAAAGVHSLGGDRRRGLGWVTCTPLGPVVDDALLARFETLRSNHG